MANKNKKNIITDERIEDVSMYGEFIPSFDQWITPDRQKKTALHLEKVTEVQPDGKDSIDKKRSN